MTNLGGGLKGTGVPLTFMKCKIDHSIKNKPIERIKKDTMMFSG